MENLATDSSLRLESFEVRGLFGEFNHSIPFCLSERITALIGPNGLGKTACLRLISALFRKQWSIFSTTDFEEIKFKFSNAHAILINKRRKNGDNLNESTGDVSDSFGVILEIFNGQGSLLDSWSPRSVEESSPRLTRIEGYLPFLTRAGPKLWSHDRTGQTFNLQEILELYADQLPEAITSSLRQNLPSVLDYLISGIDCHLIETQRLLVFQREEMRRAAPQSSLAISHKAQILKSIIARDLATYAATSQSLDRSFPRRVLSQQGPSPSDGIKSRLEELDNLRKGLTDAGILEPEPESFLPDVLVEVEDSAIATVLNVYVDDTRKKLNVLESLREKILLFIELIDERFSPKFLEVNRNSGFIVKRSTSIVVPLEKLSSGEQHQLVLFFELLFELQGNALILIDEPELSLHVGWQKKFVADLKRIIDLNCFDVLLATHSPQLIGEWDNLVVELGDVEAL